MKNLVQDIIKWIKEYFEMSPPDTKAVIGISGGKDSTIATALLVEALGKDRVIGVRMPQGVQSDIDIAREVCDYFGIESYEINIGNICETLYQTIGENYKENPVVSTNTPARIRMTILYAIAGMYNGRVVNTSNASEIFIGYSTKNGDGAGDFSITRDFTVRELKKIGYYLGLPKKFIEKVPEDGMSGKTDEEKLGFSYEVVDDILMYNEFPDEALTQKITNLYTKNLHKIFPMPYYYNKGYLE